MIYHVLNGDALVERFSALKLPGEMVVARECMIEGDLSGSNLDVFYKRRAAYLERTYKESGKNYQNDVVSEFTRLTSAPPGSTVNLWFGYDLFCFANMLFVLALLERCGGGQEVYVVYPSYLSGEDVWLDFGGASEERLLACYNNRVRFGDEDLELASLLWQAYKTGDLPELTRLSKTTTHLFPFLEEVCRAHIERFEMNGSIGRPERILEKLLDEGLEDFPSLFKAFSATAGIYGFGDAQVARIYERVMKRRSSSK
jgi:hypothetical protein